MGLHRRYSESRRPHPSSPDGSINEGIRLERLLLDPLSMALLEGRFAPGDRIVAGLENDQLVFARAKDDNAENRGAA